MSSHSLFSPKKGAVFSFVLLAAVALLVVGILSVTGTSGPSFAQQFTPRWVQASAVNASINITITNIAGSTAAIKRIDFTRPGGVGNHECGANLPDGWTCTRPGGTPTVVQFSTTGAGITAGNSAPFNINITPPATGGNQTFVIDTFESAGGANGNLSGTPTILNVNSSVDNDFPFVQLLNISARRSDGTRIVISGAQTTGLYFLPNTSDGYLFVINASDNASGMDNGRVTLYYNISTLGNSIVNLIDYRNASTTNVSSFQASNGSIGGPLSLYTITLNISSMAGLNGTRIAFIILANDSVGNGNVSNSSNNTAVSTFNYNFTIDAVAPQFTDMILSNGSQVNTNAINTTSTQGSTVKYILNSSVFINLSVQARDDGGAGTVRVQVMNRSGTLMDMIPITGNNGSAGLTTWTLNGSSFNVSGGNYNITTLVTGFNGDGKYNLSFAAIDNVSNVNNTFNVTIEVDDNSPTGNTMSNISINTSSTLSVGNTTLDNSTFNATQFVVRLQTANNINNLTRNVSVFGNKGLVYNLTYESGSASGTAIWNLTFGGNSTITRNLTQLCDTLAADGTTCNLRFNFSDVLGRDNNTVNLTIAVDGLAPNVSILSPVFLTTNYSGTALVNVSVNDSVGPLQNVSFRIITGSTNLTTGEGFYNTTTINVTNGANMTNWIPMSLNSGGNSQFSAQGYWSFTINLTALNFTDNSYIIQINATDSAGRQNFSTNTTGVVFDSSPPQNISILTPSTNTFQNANFTVNINATERVSGLLNVSVRLENGTQNSPWVGVNQVISALTASAGGGETQRFNASTFNLTFVGGIALNASDGNFTLRLNVTDTAGNQNTSVAINFTVDTIQPKISFVTPNNGINQSGNFTVNVTVTESNVNTVFVRWENGTITNGNSNNGTFANNPMTQGTATTYNSTFTNFTDGSKPMLDGNYTIRLNITDKAGNYNDTIFIQLVLDKNAPIVGAAAPAANSIQTGNFLANMSFNDTSTWNLGISSNLAINTTNINTTRTSPIIAPALFRLENSTFNGSWVNMSLAEFNMTNENSNRTNATFTFSSVANGLYNIRFAINDTAGNKNSSVTITNITLDNIAPGVAISIINVSPAVGGGVGSSGTITFNATVTDNLPLNISITNWSQGQGVAYGVFYRFENSTFNGSWLPMNTTSFQNTVQNNTGMEHTAIFSASNNTATSADGDYKIRINVTDKANNQNTSVFTSITIQNGGSKVRATNLTFQGGYVTGSDTNQTSPTFLVNTTTNATCLYSIDTPVTNYDFFLPQTTSNTLGNNISRQHSTALGFSPDRAANGYTMYYVCKDVGGNFTALDGATSLFTYGVDTRNFFNITMGSVGTNKVRGDYFATGWNSFTLPKTTLLANTGVPTNYNVTNVLSSLGNSGLTTANFTVVFAYNGSDWASYRVGGAATFTNFTADTPTASYYINITTANERLEIN